MTKAYVPTGCRRCGEPKREKKYRFDKPRYCQPCEKAVQDAYPWNQHICGSTDMSVYRRACTACDAEAVMRKKAAAQRGADKRKANNPRFARPVIADMFWAHHASSCVAAAKRKGILPQLDGTIACVDCGAPAKEYDHRDYGRPLDVVPVCRCCNKKRGTAIWPHADQFKFALVGAAPSEQKAA
jgi:hypothetical protein